MQVIHLINEFWYGGIQESTYALCRGLPDISHYVFGHTTGPMENLFSSLHNVEVNSLWDKQYTGLDDFVVGHGIDIVHKQMGGGDESRMLWPLRRPDRLCAVVESVHCPRDAKTPEDIVDHTCVASSYTYGMQTHSKPTSLVYYGLEHIEPVRNRESIRDRLRIPDNVFVIGRIGRLSGSKLVHDTLRCVILLQSEGLNVHCIIGGAYPMDEGSSYAQRLLQVCQSFPFVHFIGEVTPIERAEYINAMDLVCYPTQGEGFGMIFAEAMHQGVPIVTYDNGANAEVVDNTGICTPYEKDPDVRLRLLTDTVKELIHDRDRLEILRENARVRSSIFTDVAYGERMGEIYENIL